MQKTFSLIALCTVLLISSLPIVGAGQKHSLDVPLKVTIAGNPNLPSGYRIVGDGRDFVDGQEGVLAKFQVDNGTNDLYFDPTNSSVRVPRALWFDFTDKIANGTIPNPWSPGLTKIDAFVRFDKVYTVPVNSSDYRTGGFAVSAGSRKSDYRVRFNPDPADVYYQVVNTPNVTARFLVSHPDCNTWIITPESVPYADFGYGSGLGPVATLFDVGSTKSSAGQYLMPFQMTLVRLNPITCP